jgi:hypothetical protein
MLAYVIYALIAVVSIALLADIAGLWRIKQAPRKGAGDPGAFPQTKFASDSPDTRHKEHAHRNGADGTAEPVHAVNVLPGKAPVAPSEARKAPAADADVGQLLARVMPDSHATEHGAPARPQETFDSEKTNVYVRPHEAPAEDRPAKREGAALASLHHVRLVSLSGHDKGASFPILPAGVVIGRHPSCHIVVVDPRVSGRHAWLGIIRGKVVLRDLKSTNGTLLNAHHNRISEDTELRSGDTIFLGGHAGVQFRLLID